MRLGITRELAHALVGAGASGGDFLGAGLSDNTTDAAAALAALRERLPGVPVVLVGHSEGAIIATRLAADEPSTASFAAYRALVTQSVDRDLLDRVATWVAARGRATDGGAAGA